MKLRYHRDILLILSFISLCASYTSALYFHRSETERKCFIETVGKKPNETLVIGSYKCELHDPKTGGFSPGICMHVKIQDPNDKIILSKGYGSEGKFSFISSIPGKYAICLYSNTTTRFNGNQLRVHLDIQVGDHAVDYENVDQKEKLKRIQLKFKKLLDQVEQITEEQLSQRYHEEDFRQTSKNTDQKILLWSIIQTCLLILIGLWLRFNLKQDYHQIYTALKLVTGNPSLLQSITDNKSITDNESIIDNKSTIDNESITDNESIIDNKSITASTTDIFVLD